jgi:UDP-glucose 4-epimerase
MKKVLVTGGAGFIGSTLVDKLIDKNIDVVIVDNLSSGKEKNLNPKAQFFKGDLNHKTFDGYKHYNTKTKSLEDTTLLHILKDVDTVFHLAATPQVQYSIENPTDNNNLTSTINILEASHKSGVKRVILSSSSAVYGNPKYTPIDENHPIQTLSPYALHKLVGEQYCKLYSLVYGLDTVCLRYFNAYGNRMPNEGAYRSVISVFMEQYKNKEPLNIVNDGEQRRDFVHVNDIVNANIRCGGNKNNFNADIFNVGTGKAYTVNEIADMFGGDKKYGEKRIEPKDSIAENAKINLDLDWQPLGNLKEWIINNKNK